MAVCACIYVHLAVWYLGVVKRSTNALLCDLNLEVEIVEIAVVMSHAASGCPDLRPCVSR